MKRLLGFFTALIILMIACAVPGSSTTAPQPLPTTDTRLENMVALTVTAALEQTQQAQPTATQIPTKTPVPTVTATPEQTSGSMLTKNEDESFLFIDTNGKYQITVPSELLAMRINEQEFLDAWLLPAAENLSIQNQLSNIQNQDPQSFRLFAIDFDEEHIDSGFVTNIYLQWDPASDLSTEEQLLKAANDYLKIFPGAEILQSEMIVLQNEIPVGLVKFQNPVTTLEDEEITAIQKQAFLLLPQGILTIALSTAESQLEFVEPLFDEMLETFQLVEVMVN